MYATLSLLLLPFLSLTTALPSLKPTSRLNSKNNMLITIPTLRHFKFHGTDTTVPLLIHATQTQTYQFVLQKSGKRVRVLGHTIGGKWFNGHREMNVTPVQTVTQNTAALNNMERKVIDTKDKLNTTLPFVAAAFIHIPSKSEDGTFRLEILSEQGKHLAYSPSFSVWSLNGNTLVNYVGKKAARTWFYATFPFLKLSSWMPGRLGRWAAKRLNSATGASSKAGKVWEESGGKGAVDSVVAKYHEVEEKFNYDKCMLRTQRGIEVDNALGRQGKLVLA